MGQELDRAGPVDKQCPPDNSIPSRRTIGSMDRFLRMQVFVRVAEAGSFTRAADRLQLPRATVSTAIQQLEAELGARLLQRTTRKVQLTHDGAAYYERCLRLLADLEEADALFRQGHGAPKGKLRIDVPGRLGRLVLAPALPDFFQRYPDIELELGVTDRPVDLVQEGVDCVVRVGELEDSGLVARRIGLLQVANCASRDYLDAHGRPQRVEELEQHWAVRYASPLNGRVEDWEYMVDSERRTLPMRSHVTVNSAEAYIACCLAGLGLIQIPAYDLRVDPALATLEEVLPQWRAAPLPISVLYPHRRHLSRRVQAFVDWAQALFLLRLQPLTVA